MMQFGDRLPIPLYHGTSSLFLKDIIELGLGGRNPIREWRVLEFARVIYPLVEEHFSCNDEYMVKAQDFKFMVEQKVAAMNFQHGDTYLSPSRTTAVRYAVNNRCGSELLTYTLDFLQELVRLKIPAINRDLFQRYPHIFEKLDISPAPLLVGAADVPFNDLIAENRSADATATLEHVCDTVHNDPDSVEVLLQQDNFRLCRPVPVEKLKLWFINVTRWNRYTPEYELHPLNNREHR